MATCGSISLWCGLCVLAALSSIGMSQFNNGAQLPQSPDNCTGYTSGAPCNASDLAERVYCLTNGSSVTGFCVAREAICGNGAQLQKGGILCMSSIRDSSSTTSFTTSPTSSFTGRSTIRSTFTQSPFNQQDRTNDQHDHKHDDRHDKHDDNAAPFSHTSFSVMVLCGFAAAASRLFSLL